MAATLTASPGALVLKLDDPARDDLDSVIVWASTTSGFTPSAANVVYEGKSLNVTIPNLTPAITHYVKYAYVSSIDVDDYVISSQLSGVPSKIDNSLIGDGAISGANFAASIKPIEIVSTLPTTGNIQGRTVFLTTDNKLYRFNGTAFVSTVPTSDLTGQITTTQITDDAITTPKLAAGAVTATELAANSVVAGKIAAAAVSTSQLAADAVTADKIEVNALRGKVLTSGVVIDGGTVTTAAVAKPTNIATTTTVNVADTTDFPSVGAAVVVSRTAAFGKKIQFRYTGKTATSFTGVSGLQWAISEGDIVVPRPLPSFTLDSYTVGDPLDTSVDAEFLFRSGSGTGIAISPSRAADVFTYTSGHTLSGGVYTSVLSGVSGLTAFSSGANSRATIIDAVSLVTTVVATTGAKTSLTLSASSSYFNASGGKLLLVSTTVSGTKKVSYSAYSGTTITIDGSVTLTAATYYVIPIFSYNVIGAELFSSVSYNNSYNGEWQTSYLSSDVEVSNNISDNLELSPSVGYGLTIWPSKKVSEFEAPALLIGAPDTVLHMRLDPASFSSIDSTYLFNVGATFALGSASFNSGDNALVAFDGWDIVQYQPISTTLRFSGFNATNADAITFNDTSNTYSFGADGQTANAGIEAARVELGNASDTTITRVSAGVIAVEGDTIATLASAQTFSGAKTFTGSIASAANAIYSMQNSNARTVADSAVGVTANQFIGWNANSTPPALNLGNQVTSAAGSYVDGYKARGGNTTAITAATSGDNMLALRGFLFDGTDWNQAVGIEFVIDGSVTNSSSPGKIVFKTAVSGSNTLSERMVIYDDGVVTMPAVYGDIVGATNRDLVIDNTGKLGYISSTRASKTEIQSLGDFEWLYELEPVSFKYRKIDEAGSYTDEPDGGVQYGLIAEDAEQIQPEIVFYDETENGRELRGVNYSKLISPLLAALQRQKQQIDDLEARLAVLEAQ